MGWVQSVWLGSSVCDDRLQKVIWQRHWFLKYLNNSYFRSNSQVPFDFAVKEVLEQLRKIAKGEYKTPDTVKRTFGTIVYAAVSLPVMEIKSLLDSVSEIPPSYLLHWESDTLI